MSNNSKAPLETALSFSALMAFLLLFGLSVYAAARAAWYQDQIAYTVYRADVFTAVLTTVLVTECVWLLWRHATSPWRYPIAGILMGGAVYDVVAFFLADEDLVYYYSVRSFSLNVFNAFLLLVLYFHHPKKRTPEVNVQDKPAQDA